MFAMLVLDSEEIAFEFRGSRCESVSHELAPSDNLRHDETERRSSAAKL